MFCSRDKPFHETEMKYIDPGDNVEFKDATLLCEFNIRQGIELIKTRLTSTLSFQNDDTIIFKHHDNTFWMGAGEMFVKQFYEQQYYYNGKDIICEKSRRGYLDEIPNDLWTMIKKIYYI